MKSLSDRRCLVVMVVAVGVGSHAVCIGEG